MNLFLRLLRLTRGERGRLGLGALIALVVLAANVALLALAGWFIAAMAAAGLAGAVMNYFTPAAAIRTFAIVRTVGRYLERLVTHDATLRFLTRLRGWVYRRIEPLAPARLTGFRRGDLLGRLVADVDTLQNAYLRILLPAAVAALGGAGALLFLGAIAPGVMPVEALLLAGVGVVLPLVAQRLGRRPGGAAVATAGNLKAEFVDGLAGLAELVALGADERHRGAIERLDRRLRAAQNQSQRLDAAALALATLALGTALIATYLMVAPAAAGKHGDPLYLPMLMFFVLAGMELVRDLPAAFRATGETAGAARRIFELADGEPAVRDPVQPASPPESFGIEFSRLRFRYASSGPWVLDGLDLDIASGKIVALVGPSGAGKSSIAGLLLRFLEYEGGALRLGNSSIRNYACAAVRARIAYVEQAGRLFSTTLAENLRIGRPGATAEELAAVLAEARLSDEVAALPQGLDTFVGTGGARLSSGQIRRVMIARALLKDAPILLLDEPTEGLDPVNERAILAALARRRGRQTVIVITHRLSGLELMDEILVLDRGRLVQRGSHAALRGEPGLYADMAAYFAG